MERDFHGWPSKVVQAGFRSWAWGTGVGGHVGTGAGEEMISGKGSKECQIPEMEPTWYVWGGL